MARKERAAKRKKAPDNTTHFTENLDKCDNEVLQHMTKENDRKRAPFAVLQFLIFVLLSVIRTLKAKLSEVNVRNKKLFADTLKLRKENALLRAKLGKKRSLPDILLSCDSDVRFFTGLDSKEAFTNLCSYISKFVKRRWRGLRVLANRKLRYFKYSPRQFGPKRKLSVDAEFLLTLMKLRLGLLRHDLAKRFNISNSLCSHIFHAWLTAMAKVFKGSLVFWPNKETVKSTMPARFKNIPDLRAIIDCSEVFIETPKDLSLQSSTWSDYKHHNTAKFLIAVAPCSAITFISPVYGGRASDKAITIDCSFLDLLEPSRQGF